MRTTSVDKTGTNREIQAHVFIANVCLLHHVEHVTDDIIIKRINVTIFRFLGNSVKSFTWGKYSDYDGLKQKGLE